MYHWIKTPLTAFIEPVSQFGAYVLPVLHKDLKRKLHKENMSESNVVAAVEAFLPKMEQANAELNEKMAQGEADAVNVNIVEDETKPHVSMDVGFVFDVVESGEKKTQESDLKVDDVVAYAQQKRELVAADSNATLLNEDGPETKKRRVVIEELVNKEEVAPKPQTATPETLESPEAVAGDKPGKPAAEATSETVEAAAAPGEQEQEEEEEVFEEEEEEESDYSEEDSGSDFQDEDDDSDFE